MTVNPSSKQFVLLSVTIGHIIFGDDAIPINLDFNYLRRKKATHGHIRPKINLSVFSTRRLNQFDASPANCHIDIKIDLFAGFYQTIEN